MYSDNELKFDSRLTRLEADRNYLSTKVKRNDRTLIGLLFVFLVGVLFIIIQLTNLNTTLTDLRTEISLNKSDIIQLKSEMVQVKTRLEIL